MGIVRSVSGHVSPTRCLAPAPLGSRRVTGVPRYYGCLRLPDTTALVLAFYTCRRVRVAPRRCPDLHGYCLLLVKLDAAFHPGGGDAVLPFASAPLLPASVLKLSAFPNAVISGLSTFTAGFTRFHCSSLAFVPTHQARCHQPACKARYQTRG